MVYNSFCFCLIWVSFMLFIANCNRGTSASILGSQYFPESTQEKVIPRSNKDFEIIIRPLERNWDTRKPLVLDVQFNNIGKESVFINFKSSFGFDGLLTSSDGYGFLIRWLPRGEERMPKESDYTEIKPGETHLMKIASYKIKAAIGEKMVAWKHHKKGEYNLSVRFASGSKSYIIPNQWEGLRGSNEVTLKVL